MEWLWNISVVNPQAMQAQLERQRRLAMEKIAARKQRQEDRDYEDEMAMALIHAAEKSKTQKEEAAIEQKAKQNQLVGFTVTKLSSLYSHSYADVTLGLFTKERITFRKPFRIVIRFLIGFVIWTACVHKHCNCRPDHKQDLRTTRYYFVPTVQIDPCMASVRISKMHTHKPRSERALCSQVFRIRLSRRITIQNTLFSVSKAWFEIDLRWPRVKSSFQIRKGSESWSKTAFGTWFIPL